MIPTILTEIQYLTDGIAIIPGLQNIISHGFSWGRTAGNMSISHGDKNEVITRVQAFLTKLHMGDVNRTVSILPEHGERIIDLNQTVYNTLSGSANGKIAKCDAMFTQMEDIPLLIKPADCTVSIIVGISGNGRKVIGLVHAGRKGLDSSLPQKAIQHMQKVYDVDISTIKIGMIPSITAKRHFIRDLTELEYPQNWNGFIQEREGLLYLDFTGLILKKYHEAGIKLNQIQYYDVDTYNAASKGETFSHRYWQMNPGIINGRMIVAAKL